VPEVTLLQCLPKGRHMDVIVEKAVELGVAAVVPVISEHVVKRPQGARGAQQADRWRRVARAAAQQCQTLWVPAVSDPVGIEEACAVGECQARFYCGSLAADARPWREVLREEKRPPPTVAVLIGPEGDLSPRERERAARSGAVGVSFGSLVLRVETAALYALSALTYEFASC
jgi:16S rRNA (uracil1498-N3)-methyltransferase